MRAYANRVCSTGLTRPIRRTRDAPGPVPPVTSAPRPRTESRPLPCRRRLPTRSTPGPLGSDAARRRRAITAVRGHRAPDAGAADVLDGTGAEPCKSDGRMAISRDRLARALAAQRLRTGEPEQGTTVDIRTAVFMRNHFHG